MRKIYKRRTYRDTRRKGASALELVVTVPIIMMLLALSIDLAALMFGFDFCDRTCRDCARVAGQMSTPDDAVNAMNAAAAAHRIDGVMIQKMYPELLIYEDYNYSRKYPTPKYGSTANYLGKNGPDNLTPAGGVNDKKQERVDYTDPDQSKSPGPYVVVRNSVVLHIPVTLDFSGWKLVQSDVNKDPQAFKVQSIYTYPITNAYSPN